MEGTPTSTGLGEARKEVIVGSGLTVSVTVLSADRPKESFTKTRIVKVPDIVGVQVRERLLAEGHPGKPV